MCVYRNHFAQKKEIEKIMHELLEMGEIHLSSGTYSSSVIMVWMKEGNWHMCLECCALNKLIVKDIFIPNIEDLLDELHGAHSSKLDLCSECH